MQEQLPTIKAQRRQQRPGLRGFCSGSFLASLGDLPARRAMPSCAFALNKRLEDV